MIFYIVLIGVPLLLGLYAQMRVMSAYRKNVQIPSRNGITGRAAAAAVMESAGIHDVEIVEVEGMLSDHYDPSNKRLALSPDNFHGTSLAALGVAAHAVARGRQPLKRLRAGRAEGVDESEVLGHLPQVGRIPEGLAAHRAQRGRRLIRRPLGHVARHIAVRHGHKVLVGYALRYPHRRVPRGLWRGDPCGRLRARRQRSDLKRPRLRRVGHLPSQAKQRRSAAI